MENSDKKPVTDEIIQYQPWVICKNGHPTVGACGTVFNPPIVTCPSCGAAIVDSGKERCGEALKKLFNVT